IHEDRARRRRDPRGASQAAGRRRPARAADRATRRRGCGVVPRLRRSRVPDWRVPRGRRRAKHLLTGRIAGLAAGIAAFAAVALLRSGLHEIAGMGSRPAYAAAVAALMALWWLTEALPIAVT